LLVLLANTLFLSRGLGPNDTRHYDLWLNTMCDYLNWPIALIKSPPNGLNLLARHALPIRSKKMPLRVQGTFATKRISVQPYPILNELDDLAESNCLP